MEQEQVRYFLVLSRTLNAARAAALCRVRRPVLEQAIRSLEQELGGTLFRGDPAALSLSEFGRLMRSHLERLLDDGEAALGTGGGLLARNDAAVRLGLLSAIRSWRLLAFLAEFGRANPGAALALNEAPLDRLTEELLDGRIHGAILAQPSPFDARLSAAPLYRERFAIAFPLGHRFAAQDFVEPHDLAGESYLACTSCVFQNELAAFCADGGVPLDAVFESEREDWILAMLASGLGICFVPEFSPLVPGLATRPLRQPEVVREVSLVTLAGRPPPRAFDTLRNAALAYSWSDEVIA